MSMVKTERELIFEVMQSVDETAFLQGVELKPWLTFRLCQVPVR